MNSILLTTKKMLGVHESDPFFDADIIVGINSAISVLTQIGVGPKNGFVITGESETWENFVGTDPRYELTKAYVFLKTKMLFDPPQSSGVMDAMNRQITEYEWRLSNA